jgi:glycosyltransferase involved in cell wall biosynthesis
VARVSGSASRERGRPAGAGARVAVTVVIAARNAAAHIASCVRSVAWAGEVLVVENDSADDTVLLALSEGATVFSHPFVTIGCQRNAAIARARHQGVLVLDADERGTPELAAEIAALLAGGPAADAYRIRRRNHFLGREIHGGGWQSDRPVRLFRRGLRYDERPVHEHVVVDAGAVGTLGGALLHYTYSSLDEYFEKLDRYSRDWAAQHFAAGRRASAFAAVVRPPARFVTMFFLRGGWRDGAHGLVLAVLAAMSVGAKYARLWERGVAHRTGAHG